jgi:hypothetical protein
MPKLLRYAALAIAFVAAFMWMKHERAADACRKAGGQWDGAANTCAPAAAAAAGSRPG